MMCGLTVIELNFSLKNSYFLRNKIKTTKLRGSTLQCLY